MALNTLSVDIHAKALPGDNCRIVLFIIDSGEITEPVERKKRLVLKLRYYLEFVLCQSFRIRNPGVEPKDVLVRVLHKIPPTEEMLEIVSINPSDDPTNRMRVEFGDIEEFERNLKSRPQK